MNKTARRLACVLLALILTLTPLIAAARVSSVRVFLDGAEIGLGDNGAYYDGVNKTVMAPLRGISELLDAEVHFDGDLGVISITKGTTEISVTLKSRSATINENRQEELSAPPIIIDGISYVPLEFIAEAFQFDYMFSLDGMYASLKSRVSYDFGASLEHIRLVFGEQSRIDKSEKGYDWYVFNKDYESYTLVGIEEGVAVAYFISGVSWSLECGVFNGMKLSSCESLMALLGYSSKNYGKRQQYRLDTEIITVFFDEQETIFAVLCEEGGYENRHSVDTLVTASLALELNDLMNCYRKNHNCSALPVDSLISSIAKNQSASMANNGYFDHTDPEGRDYSERMADAGYGACYISEIIAQAYPNSFEAFAALLSDESYCELMLASYDSVGCGVAYNANSPGLLYYTQLFYAVKD